MPEVSSHHDFKELLKRALQRLRAEKGLSAAQIEDEAANAAHVSSYVIQIWCKPSGQRLPEGKTLHALALYLSSEGGLRNPQEKLSFLKYAGERYPEKLYEDLFHQPFAVEGSPGGGASVVDVSRLAPFVTHKPILHPRQFFGRQQLLKRIFADLQKLPLPNLTVHGPRRSGKTSLLMYLKDIHHTNPAQLRLGQRRNWLPGAQSYRWIFVDFQDHSQCTQQNFLHSLLTGFHLPMPEQLTLSSFMQTARAQIQQPTIVLIDEIACALNSAELGQNPVWESLRSLANNYSDGNLSFILSSDLSPQQLAEKFKSLSSPFFNTFTTYPIGRFTPAEAADLVASSPIPFSSPDIAWIVAEGDNWPTRLQIACAVRLNTIDEPGDAWKTEARQQLAPYDYLLEL